MRKKPYEELINTNPTATNTLSMGRRHTPCEILDRKLLGLSPSLIYLTPVVALLGLGSSAYEYYSNGEIKPLYLLFFVSILIVYVWIIRRIRAIEAADE